jgi:hypothetical protein
MVLQHAAALVRRSSASNGNAGTARNGKAAQAESAWKCFAKHDAFCRGSLGGAGCFYVKVITARPGWSRQAGNG